VEARLANNGKHAGASWLAQSLERVVDSDLIEIGKSLIIEATGFIPQNETVDKKIARQVTKGSRYQ
jgi:hypothetical protein